jgi:predicted small secreted protein
MTGIRLAALLAIMTLAACETVKGVGRDITRAADTVDQQLL